MATTPVQLTVSPTAQATVLDRLITMLALGTGSEADDDIKLASIALRQEFTERAAALRAASASQATGTATASTIVAASAM